MVRWVGIWLLLFEGRNRIDLKVVEVPIHRREEEGREDREDLQVVEEEVILTFQEEVEGVKSDLRREVGVEGVE